MTPTHLKKTILLAALLGSSTMSAALSACSSNSSGGAPGSPDASTTDEASTTEAGGDGAATCQPSDAAVDDAAVAAGLAAVTKRKCRACHEMPEAGPDMVLSGSDVPVKGIGYGSNLTPDPATGLGCWSDDQIANAIVSGTDLNGHPLCVMPKYGLLDAGIQPGSDELRAIVEYLRSLPAVVQAVPQTNCSLLDAGTGSAAGDAGDGGAVDAGDAGTPEDSSAEATVDAGADASWADAGDSGAGE